MLKWFWLILFISFQNSETKEINFNEIYIRNLKTFEWEKKIKKGSFIFKNNEIYFLNMYYTVLDKCKINNDYIIQTNNINNEKSTFYLTKNKIFVYLSSDKKTQIKILY